MTKNETIFFNENLKNEILKVGFKLTELGNGDCSDQFLLQIGNIHTQISLPDNNTFSDGGEKWLKYIFDLDKCDIDYTSSHGSWFIITKYWC